MVCYRFILGRFLLKKLEIAVVFEVLFSKVYVTAALPNKSHDRITNGSSTIKGESVAYTYIFYQI
jgi:hypothetical protein